MKQYKITIPVGQVLDFKICFDVCRKYYPGNLSEIIEFEPRPGSLFYVAKFQAADDDTVFDLGRLFEKRTGSDLDYLPDYVCAGGAMDIELINLNEF
jgi:hypothetical protein